METCTFFFEFSKNQAQRLPKVTDYHSWTNISTLLDQPRAITHPFGDRIEQFNLIYQLT